MSFVRIVNELRINTSNKDLQNQLLDFIEQINPSNGQNRDALMAPIRIVNMTALNIFESNIGRFPKRHLERHPYRERFGVVIIRPNSLGVPCNSCCSYHDAKEDGELHYYECLMFECELQLLKSHSCSTADGLGLNLERTISKIKEVIKNVTAAVSKLKHELLRKYFNGVSKAMQESLDRIVEVTEKDPSYNYLSVMRCFRAILKSSNGILPILESGLVDH